MSVVRYLIPRVGMTRSLRAGSVVMNYTWQLRSAIWCWVVGRGMSAWLIAMMYAVGKLEM